MLKETKETQGQRKTHSQTPKTAGKLQKIKMKRYSVPDNHFDAYISAPWPYVTWEDQPSTVTQRAQQEQTNINKSLLWVSCMVQDLCKVAMDETQLLLYRKGTTADVIIQMKAPESVDVAAFQAILGAHRDFTTVASPSEDLHNTIVYEYNYKHCNDPARVEQQDENDAGWEERSALGASFNPQRIDAAFPVKRNGQYPLPLPVKWQHRRKQSVIPLRKELVLEAENPEEPVAGPSGQ
ncbi:hypothetical protein C8F01DRAFT_1085767 [Mycena amicta]|nr:hypothetical protein C8F01DRAFT_1085767 [Mycena amicta]